MKFYRVHHLRIVTFAILCTCIYVPVCWLAFKAGLDSRLFAVGTAVMLLMIARVLVNRGLFVTYYERHTEFDVSSTFKDN